MKKLKLIICFAVSIITISACSNQAKVDVTVESSTEAFTSAESITVVASEAESTTVTPTETESTTVVATEPETTTEASVEPEKPATDFFETVYAPYANREKPFNFYEVKAFSESCGYKTEITNPSDEEVGTIIITDDNGDYVYFAFSPINGVETIMIVSFYQASSNSEVSLDNYSSDGSRQYDRLSTHVIGESEMNVKSVDQQRQFLFK